ncbi:TPA: hypothetical protein N0F65_003530 [Lagenidium giganteum]|uniref:ABC transporter domain-containing protein n=1 Tax=Lagenidium giganteum TaxID=4803 RepID=A0AAV2Z2V8_9STRA|nr:TPA: hypothetical protein N0F65_003530 [Lagenidium giganteum]
MAMGAGHGDYGSVGAAASLPLPLPLRSTTLAAHPEHTSSWFSWLFMLFNEELFRQKHRPPAPWRRLFTRHCARIASIDDVVPLPLEWQCAAAKDELSAALEASNGDVMAAALRMKDSEVLHAHAWSLASAVFYVAYAMALLELLAVVTRYGDSEIDGVRVAALGCCVIAAQVAEVVARQHRVLSSLHLKVRVAGGLCLMVMERAVRHPWIQLVGDESDVPPGIYIHDLHTQIDRSWLTIECTRDIMGDVVKLTANWLLLEWFVGHHAGSLVIMTAVFWIGLTSALARLRWRGRERLEMAHLNTFRALNEFYKWAFPIKLYGWESKMLERILDLRGDEERARVASLPLDMAPYIPWTTNCLTIVVVLVVLWAQHIKLTANCVFAIALFAQPVQVNVQSLFAQLQTLPPDNALDQFLTPTKPPVKQRNRSSPKPHLRNTQESVVVQNAVVCVKQRLLFVNISFEIERGELAILYGPAGAGKSTILRILSGEVTITSGSLMVPTQWRVAYCVQEHWLQTGTIRSNILFGSPFDQVKYQRVLNACGLLEDLERLVGGDSTFVGPQGANLSGGQKARVALARACYADADLYLLDCTLDCVDPLVQQEVFDKCVCNLLRDKTVVMVTQSPELASSDWADRRLEIGATSVLEIVRKKRQGMQWLSHFHLTLRSTTEMVGRIGLMVWAGGSGAIVLLAIAISDWWYLANHVTSRDVMRTAGSVFVQHEDWLLEVSRGLSCIRPLGKTAQDGVLQQYSEFVNAMMVLNYSMVAHNGYILVRFAIAAAWPLLIVVYVAVVASSVEPSMFGLLLYCAVTLRWSAIFLSTGLSNPSCDLISVREMDRLTSLATQLSEENTTLTNDPPDTWPSEGEVRFDNVTFTYPSQIVKPTPVLRNVSFVVKAGEKIGLVGRTGSGKTSVAMALFRIHEVTSGRIVVDGLDTRLLGLQELRRRLSIIPQSPVFYRCSVRSYLDPFGDFDDADLWRVLQTAGLAGSGVGLVTSLDDMLAEDGVNWSVGERQLLSLARSLLKPSKVLVLDEAFSSLEQERDDAVLGIVNREFVSSTVFLITHRMDQVLGFDRILVMDNGRAVEMGSVEELLSNPDSRFYELLESSPLTK